MSVQELIDELKRQPNLKVSVDIRAERRTSDGKAVRREVDAVTFDGRCVIIEGM